MGARRAAFIFVLATAGTVFVAIRVYSQPAKGKSEGIQITVGQLRSATVIGELGLPLGALATIEGYYKDMTYTRRKHDDGRLALIVDKVDGLRLAEPLEFEVDYDLKELVKPADKVRFKLLGYETGRFAGDVDGVEAYEVAVAHVSRPFGFQSDFVWLKDVTNNIARNDERVR